MRMKREIVCCCCSTDPFWEMKNKLEDFALFSLSLSLSLYFFCFRLIFIVIYIYICIALTFNNQSSLERHKRTMLRFKLDFNFSLAALVVFWNTSNYFSFVFLEGNSLTQNDTFCFFPPLCVHLFDVQWSSFLFSVFIYSGIFLHSILCITERSSTCFEYMYTSLRYIEMKITRNVSSHCRYSTSRVRIHTHANQYCVSSLVCFLVFIRVAS